MQSKSEILVCHTQGSIIFDHVQTKSELKILSEILVCHTGGSIIFDHVQTKSEILVCHTEGVNHL